MRIFIIFMAIWWSAASFSYAESVAKEKITATNEMVLSPSAETETLTDTKMYAKSKSTSKKKKSYSKSSKSSTRSSSKKKKPYILKDGCKFTLYTNIGNATVISKESQASPVILEKSGIRIVIKNCKIIENQRNIRIHLKKPWWKFW